MKTHDILIEYYKTYPQMQAQDLFKFLYQSVFGCEHMISSPEAVIDYIKEEGANAENPDIEPLDGNYSRVHLGYLNLGLSAETLGKLFFLSAKHPKGDIYALEEKLLVAKELVTSGKLPLTQFDESLNDWKAKGYPALHHSDTFRACYKPSYRVIANDYIPYLPLFTKIDSMMKKCRVNLAIEGGSASGKSTLGDLLCKIYDCNLFHMDDFFLQPHQRTKERFNEPGGNVDRERFLSEVLVPLCKDEVILYKRFDCASLKVLPSVEITPKMLNITEGAYSTHPDLKGYYNLTVFLDISSKLQKQRVLKRNPEMADRFFSEWIPLEHKYFDAFDIKSNCDLIINTFLSR